MNEIDYWNQFEHSGKIDDYLVFKLLTSQTYSNKEHTDADKDRRYSNS